MAHHGFHSRYQDKEYAAEDAKAWTLDLSNEIKVEIKQEEKTWNWFITHVGFHGCSWVFCRSSLDEGNFWNSQLSWLLQLRI